MFVEDVGRHNAIDTIAGWMWMHGVDGADKTFYTTGRLTSEMVMKASLAGLRVTEVPPTLRPDGRGRPPHLPRWRDAWRQKMGGGVLWGDEK